jgi:DNA-binding NarL/FixJ family response regulator
VNISVLIIDAIRITGFGTAMALRRHPQLRPYHVTTLWAALLLARLIQPRVILLEPYRLNSPGAQAVQPLRRLNAPILLFTELRDRCEIQAMIRAGADGYLGKRAAVETLIHTVVAAHHDRISTIGEDTGRE